MQGQHLATDPDPLDSFAPEPASAGIRLGPRAPIAEIAPRRTTDQDASRAAPSVAAAVVAKRVVLYAGVALAIGGTAWLASGMPASRTSAARISELLTEVRNTIDGTPPAAAAPAEPTRPAAPSKPRSIAVRKTRRETQPLVPRSVVPAGLAADLVPAMTPPAIDGESVAGSDTPGPIYSSADADVRPPELLTPQLPTPPSGPRIGAANQMELIVSAAGRVERVRLIAGPTRLPDVMLLSGAKMWRFKPAVKDGRAVQYRTVVTWVTNP